MSEVKVNKVTPRSGTTLTIGDSGDTTNVVGTLQNNGAALVGDISSVVAGTNLSGGGTSGAVTINLADASTSAKGAASFSSDNFAASSGAVTIKDLGIATGEIQDNAVTLAKMASGTDGNIISYDASGNPVAVATGNDGQVLTSAGAGAPPVFETLSVTPADGSITLAKMASGTDGNIISYDTSGNPVAVATGGSGQILTSSGAGAIPTFQDPNFNRPYFAAKAATTGSLSDNTWYKVNFTNEVVDSDGKYDASNSKFTPTVAGWYQCNLRVLLYNPSIDMCSQSNCGFYKNGSNNGNSNSNAYRSGSGLFYFVTPNKQSVIYLDTDDYLEAYVRPNAVDNSTSYDGSACMFSAFKLI
jgi:hypothetical protein